MKSKHALVMAGAAILLISAVILTAGCTGSADSADPTDNITGTWKYTGTDGFILYIEATNTSFTSTVDDNGNIRKTVRDLTKVSPVGYTSDDGFKLYELGGKLVLEDLEAGEYWKLSKYRGEIPQLKPDYSSDPVCGTWSGHYTYKSKSYEVAPQFHPDGTLDMAVNTSLGLEFIHTTWKCAETGTSRKYTTAEGDLVFYLSDGTLYSSSSMSDLWVYTGATAITYKKVN